MYILEVFRGKAYEISYYQISQLPNQHISFGDEQPKRIVHIWKTMLLNKGDNLLEFCLKKLIFEGCTVHEEQYLENR